MESKCCWFLACGTVPPSRMPRLERALRARLEEKRAQSPELSLCTDFYYYGIFPHWPGGQELGGSITCPGSSMICPGEEAVLFCLTARKDHRETLEELEIYLRKNGCPYSVALL